MIITTASPTTPTILNVKSTPSSGENIDNCFSFSEEGGVTESESSVSSLDSQPTSPKSVFNDQDREDRKRRKSLRIRLNLSKNKEEANEVKVEAVEDNCNKGRDEEQSRLLDGDGSHLVSFVRNEIQDIGGSTERSSCNESPGRSKQGDADYGPENIEGCNIRTKLERKCKSKDEKLSIKSGEQQEDLRNNKAQSQEYQPNNILKPCEESIFKFTIPELSTPLGLTFSQCKNGGIQSGKFKTRNNYCIVIDVKPNSPASDIGFEIADLICYEDDEVAAASYEEVTYWFTQRKRPFDVMIKRGDFQARRIIQECVMSEIINHEILSGGETNPYCHIEDGPIEFPLPPQSIVYVVSKTESPCSGGYAYILKYHDNSYDVQYIYGREEKNIHHSYIRQVSLDALPPIGKIKDSTTDITLSDTPATTSARKKIEGQNEKINHPLPKGCIVKISEKVDGAIPKEGSYARIISFDHSYQTYNVKLCVEKYSFKYVGLDCILSVVEEADVNSTEDSSKTIQKPNSKVEYEKKVPSGPKYFLKRLLISQDKQSLRWRAYFFYDKFRQSTFNTREQCLLFHEILRQKLEEKPLYCASSIVKLAAFARDAVLSQTHVTSSAPQVAIVKRKREEMIPEDPSSMKSGEKLNGKKLKEQKVDKTSTPKISSYFTPVERPDRIRKSFDEVGPESTEKTFASKISSYFTPVKKSNRIKISINKVELQSPDSAVSQNKATDTIMVPTKRSNRIKLKSIEAEIDSLDTSTSPERTSAKRKRVEGESPPKPSPSKKGPDRYIFRSLIEEKDDKWRAYFIFDKFRYLGVYATRDEAVSALGAVRNKLNPFNISEGIILGEKKSLETKNTKEKYLYKCTSVCLDKRCSKWRLYFTYDKKRQIGAFVTRQDAFLALDLLRSMFEQTKPDGTKTVDEIVPLVFKTIDEKIYMDEILNQVCETVPSQNVVTSETSQINETKTYNFTKPYTFFDEESNPSNQWIACFTYDKARCLEGIASYEEATLALEIVRFKLEESMAHTEKSIDVAIKFTYDILSSKSDIDISSGDVAKKTETGNKDERASSTPPSSLLSDTSKTNTTSTFSNTTENQETNSSQPFRLPPNNNNNDNNIVSTNTPGNSNWVPSENPWGQNGYTEEDFILLSSTTCHSHNTRRKSHLNKKLYPKNSLESDSSLGYRAFLLTRDRQNKFPWGFTYDYNDNTANSVTSASKDSCVITSIMPCSPAEAAKDILGLNGDGLQVGDVLIAMNGQLIAGMMDDELSFKLETSNCTLKVVIARSKN